MTVSPQFDELWGALFVLTLSCPYVIITVEGEWCDDRTRGADMGADTKAEAYKNKRKGAICHFETVSAVCCRLIYTHTVHSASSAR